MKTLRALERWIVVITIFLIPSQLALHFWPHWSFIFGLRVDYLSPTVYLTDLLTILLVILWVVRDKKEVLRVLTKNKAWIITFFAIAGLNITLSTSIQPSIIRWLKIFEMVLLVFYMMSEKTLSKRSIYKILFFSAIFVSVIGIAQVIKSGTLGGILYFFGERTFTTQTPGIALAAIAGNQFLRAYSTFSHPNSLAGFLGVTLLLLPEIKTSRALLLIGVAAVVVCLLLSFSLGVLIAITLALIIGFGIKNEKRRRGLLKLVFSLSILTSLLLPIFSKSLVEKTLGHYENISQRLNLAFLSGKMISEKFLVGEGLNTFTLNTPKFEGVLTSQWFLQPVHNIFLLIFSEVGIIGLLIFWYGLYKLFVKLTNENATVLIAALLFIVISGTVDHYWLTLQQNLLLFSLLVGLSLRPSKL